MKFASARQIIVLVVVFAAALYVLDYYKNPQLWHSKDRMESSKKGIRLSLWMNHLCCTDCLADVRQALAALPGLDLENVTGPKQLLSQPQANSMRESLPEYGNSVDIPITDLGKLDFSALDRALRDKGLVAGRMEFSGVEHFRLEAVLDHMCCGMCERATHEGIAFLKARGLGGQFKWLDSVRVDSQKKTVVAYARYLEPGKTMDVAEFIAGLNYIGYAPRSVRILVGEEAKIVGDLKLGYPQTDEICEN